MITKQKAISSAEAALNATEYRLLQLPNYGVYLHAKSQLKVMIDFLKAGSLPEKIDREFIDIAVMAVKENLEESDADYADKLMLADYEFKMVDI